MQTLPGILLPTPEKCNSSAHRGIGIDTLNFDVGSNLNFNVHRLLLGANLWGMENVAHMGKVPPTGATVRTLFTLV